MLIELQIKTSKREELINITGKISETIKKVGTENGICLVYTPHTTAAITINENADPDVCTDMISGLERISPLDKNYRHMEGNSDAHIKSSLIGTSQTLIIKNRELKLGTWQGVYFCEFDGPRNRQAWVKIITG